jgi:hypothetical protein
MYMENHRKVQEIFNARKRTRDAMFLEGVGADRIAVFDQQTMVILAEAKARYPSPFFGQQKKKPGGNSGILK